MNDSSMKCRSQHEAYSCPLLTSQVTFGRDCPRSSRKEAKIYLFLLALKEEYRALRRFLDPQRKFPEDAAIYVKSVLLI
jgi:hypothetical protein